MKKRLEADLISIAHRVLKIKNKSEIDQLYLETRKLYETLSVLKFYGDNYEQFKTEINENDLTDKLTDFLEEKEVVNATALVEEKVIETTIEENILEESTEIVEEILIEEKVVEQTTELETNAETNQFDEKKIIDEALEKEDSPEINKGFLIEELDKSETSDLEKGLSSDKKALNDLLEKLSEKDEPKIIQPEFEVTFDSKINDVVVVEPSEKPTQTIFDDFLNSDYSEPVFVKPEDLEKEVKKHAETTSRIAEFESKPKSLNDKISKGITIGLNDRVAFMKHLFDDNSEDYNRVLSQLITFDSLLEVQDFIDNFVKPDYNNWDGKEEYAERFMEIIEKKFS